MTREKQDRRSQRTQQTLINALIELLDKNNYDSISINDIVARANVGRSTFYAHYQSKDDLLKSGFERVLEMLLNHLSLDESDQTLRLDTTHLFQHARGHYELYRTLVWGSGHELLTRDGHARLSAKFQEHLAVQLIGKPEPSIPLTVLCYAMAGNLLILLQWWLDNKMPYTPDKMDAIFQKFTMVSVRNILGLTKI